MYKPIENGQIRLLRTSESISDGAPRSYSFEIANLEGCEPYVAISYTWQDACFGRHEQTGSSDNTSNAYLIDGQVSAAVAKLSPMLKAISAAKYQTVWIDQLCINQSDMDERARQVQQMWEIYARADKVIIFLGLSTDNPGLAQLASDGAYSNNVPFQLYPRDEHALIAKHPYWDRAWILQEIAAAKDVDIMYLDGALPLTTLKKATDLAAIAAMVEQRGSRNASFSTILDYVRDQRKEPLLSVLYATWASRQTNRHDAIYAKLGMANDADLMVPKLEYNIPVEQVLREFVRQHVVATRHLSIICFARPDRELDLPSWAPDWSTVSAVIPLHSNYIPHVAGSRVQRLGGDSVPITYSTMEDDLPTLCNGSFQAIIRAAMSADCNILQARGINIDNVGPGDRAASIMPTYEAPQHDFIQCIIGTLSTGRVRRGMFGHPGFCEAAIAIMTFHFAALEALEKSDNHFLGSDPRDRATMSLEHCYQTSGNAILGGRTLKEWLRAAGGTVHETTRDHDGCRIDKVETVVSKMHVGRKLLELVSGRPALVPKHTKDGDLICILCGCPVPVVLRPQGERFEFIGECYVVDYMSEATVLRMLPGHLRIVDYQMI